MLVLYWYHGHDGVLHQFTTPHYWCASSGHYVRVTFTTSTRIRRTAIQNGLEKENLIASTPFTTDEANTQPKCHGRPAGAKATVTTVPGMHTCLCGSGASGSLWVVAEPHHLPAAAARAHKALTRVSPRTRSYQRLHAGKLVQCHDTSSR